MTLAFIDKSNDFGFGASGLIPWINSHALMIGDTDNKLYIYAPDNSQIASYDFIMPDGQFVNRVALLTSASAVGFQAHTGTRAMSVVELSSGFCTLATGVVPKPTRGLAQYQSTAASLASGITFVSDITENVIYKLTPTSITQLTPEWLGQDLIWGMDLLPNGNFIMGSSTSLYEVDGDGNLIKQWSQVPISDTRGTFNNIVVCGDYVLCRNGATNQDSYITLRIHWPTGKIVEEAYLGASNNFNVLTTHGASGISAISGRLGAVFSESEPARGLTYSRDTAFIDLSNPIDFLTMSGNRVFLTSSFTIFCFSITSDLVPTTVAIYDDGEYQEGRLIRIIDDPAGPYVYCDTPIGAAPEIVYAPPGKDIIDFVVYGKGVNEKGEVSCFST